MSAAIDATIWQPNPGRQEMFLKAREEEILYGGAAGGGKTDALIIDALGLNQDMGPAIQHPKYRALMVRPEYGELKHVVDRMKELYPLIVKGAEYFETAREWRFPSGARIELSYLKDEKDKFRYRSREFQYVGWEELTQHPTGGGYDYVSYSRVRGIPGLDKYIRATTNPDGPGHDWVKAKWRIADEGYDTNFSVKAGTQIMRRRFIPAKVSDNPKIDHEYANRLHLLSIQERRALLEGSWANADYRGAIFKPQIVQAFEEQRILDFAYDPAYPVNTAWDMGAADRTAIWFHQRVGLQNRIINYYEAEAETISHFAQVLKDMGYTYEMHYLPHDAGHVKQGQFTNKSLAQMLRDLRVSPVRVVPKTPTKKLAIEHARQLFATCYFEENACKRGLSRLRHYRYKFDANKNVFSREPLHDVNSNGADAFMTLAQGYRAPGDIVRGAAKSSDAGRSYRRRSLEEEERGDVLC